MDILQPIVLLLAAPAAFGLFHRLRRLDPRRHQPEIIILHIAMGIGVAWATYRGIEGYPTVSDIAAVVTALAWLSVSRPSWGDEVPVHFETRPGELGRPEFKNHTAKRSK